MMRWFGPAVGALAADLEHIDTPVGCECGWCGEPIAADDSGVTMPYVPSVGQVTRMAYHFECHARSVIGSIAHQQRRCICFGGAVDENDPPGISKRQAAREALAYFRRSMHRL